MKKSKILAPALAILCLSTAASVTGTVAWFAANNTVTADGMAIRASAPASIVISKDALPDETTISTEVIFEDAVTALKPCTYVPSLVGQPNLGQPNLNGELIDKSTGLPKLESDYSSMTYNAVAVNTHYIHKVVYIATAPHTESISDGKVIKVAMESPIAVSGTLLAGSISYFVKYVSALANDEVGEYVGTLNLAGFDRALNQATLKTPNDLTLYTTSLATPIPNADSGLAVRIDMFAYFDGGLLSEYDADTYANNQAFVYTDVVNAANLQLNNTFDLI